MKITVLGTGTFYVNKERSGPAYLLEADNKKILIDCGPGALMRLSEIGLKPDDIDYVLLTHFHADHTSDLFAFQMSFRLKDFFSKDKEYKTPTIYGPKGIDTFTSRLADIYQLPAFTGYTKIIYKEVVPEFKIGNVEVSSCHVQHSAFGIMADAYAYRFDFEGKSFVFSGDCIRGDEITRACKSVDLFVCDTSYSKGNGGPAHMDTTDIGEISKSAEVGRVVLTHFYPNTENIDLVSEVNEVYAGKVERAKDLMEIEL